MPLPTTQLDDRTFDQLLADARQRAGQIAPDWDLAPGDPGAVLLDIFAWLTESLTYRLNRMPDKAYIEFLNLLGVRMQPPAAAAVRLIFSRSRPSNEAVEISRGTRVAVSRPAGSGEVPVFTTAESVRIEAGKTEAASVAYHAELVQGELLGHGTGLPGLSLNTRNAPIAVGVPRDQDLVIGVETNRESLESRAPAVSWQGRVFRVWTEASSFANLPPDQLVYVADRASGVISFAPAVRRVVPGEGLEPAPRALAAIPPAGREIRAWYWRGGGSHGNVAAGVLTVAKNPIAGISVRNPEPAAGGRDAETLQNALVRGPIEFRSLERAVTASDFEKFATEGMQVARAKAITRAEIWAHAEPGTVEVLLVPKIPAEELVCALDRAKVAAYQSREIQRRIQAELDLRRPLGTRFVASWAHLKCVRVRARIVAYPEEDAGALAERFRTRLFQTVNPATWRFGQPLRASHVYDLILAEPGVDYVDDIAFEVEESPDRDVLRLARDHFQRNTWYAAAGDSVYRSTNNGDGWERCRAFANERVQLVVASPQRAGLLAAVTAPSEDASNCALSISEDAGETWSDPVPAAFRIEDAAWSVRQGAPVLFLATRVGLYEVVLTGSRDFLQVPVDPDQPQRGFNAVAVVTDVRGGVSVALASQDGGGVFLSPESGRTGSFRNIGLEGSYVATLTAQYDGPRAFLWAGFAATGGAKGTGAARLELVGSQLAAGGWTTFGGEWQGGSCWRLGFDQMKAYAASYQRGVLALDTTVPSPQWRPCEIDCGLPQRGTDRIFQWVTALATGVNATVLCGGASGVFRSVDGAKTFQKISSPVHEDKVTLPETWLFCSGAHQVQVRHADETD